MAKKKGNGLLATILILVLVVALVFGVVWMTGNNDNPMTEGGSGVVTTETTNLCGTDGYTDLKVNMYNNYNETGSENYDVSYYIFQKQSDGNYVYNNVAVTDTTSPTATDLTCSQDYALKVVSTSGASGDSSYVVDASSDNGDARVEDGVIYFTAKAPATNIRANAPQHASLQVRAYDNNQNNYMYDSSDASATDYETDGVTFTSTTDNATASDETLGFDILFDVKAVESDTEGNDRGILVLLEMPTTKWDLPAVYVNGNKISKITLSGAEADAYVDYEYAFLIPADVVIKDGSEGMELRVVNQLKSGISSVTADPQIDLAIRGNSLTTMADDVLEASAVTDASTPAQVHDLFDITIDMT